MYKILFFLSAIHGIQNMQASEARCDSWGYASDDSWSDDSEDSQVTSLTSRKISPDLTTSPSAGRKNQAAMMISFDLPADCVKVPKAEIIGGMITISGDKFKYRIFLQSLHINDKKISIIIKNLKMFVIFHSKNGNPITKDDIQIHDSYKEEQYVKENYDSIKETLKNKNKKNKFAI